MNAYEERKAAKIERIEKRIERKKDFASKNDLSLFGEEKSGIPMGQPILVGHHSERRHRKHIEQINNKVRKGYEAAKEASRLEDKIESISNRRAIDSDNPNASSLLQQKLDSLTVEYSKNKAINQLVKKCRYIENKTEKLSQWLFEMEQHRSIVSCDQQAIKLLTADFAGRIGIPKWWFTNCSAEMRRVKKRIEQVKTLVSGWPDIIGDGVMATCEEGRILIIFENNPTLDYNQSLMKDELKRSPFAFKWSPTRTAWVRKHTPTTQTEYFRKQIMELFTKWSKHGK